MGCLTPRTLLSQLEPEEWAEWVRWFRRHPFGDQFIVRQIAEFQAVYLAHWGGYSGRAPELLLDFWRQKEEDTPATAEDIAAEPMTAEDTIRQYMERKGRIEGWHTVPKEFRPATHQSTPKPES